MTRRPPIGYDLLLSLIAAGTCWAALTAWRGFLDGAADYLVPVAVVAITLAVTGAVQRWVGVPRTVVALVQLALATALVSGQLGGGPVPLGDTGDEVLDALQVALESARTYAAPIGGGAPPVAPLLIVGGAVFVVLVDTLACTLRRVPVAGLALLAIYSVPAGLVETGPGWLAFVLAAAGFLAMLHLDSREHLLRWGRPLGPDEHNPWSEARPIPEALRIGAGRIGVTATALALVVPPLVPVLDLNLLGLGPGSGDDEIRIVNPRTDLRRDLERAEDIPLLRITTDDPRPDHFRIAALNRFTGNEWSTGDRGVPDEATATGKLPKPVGLSPDVPRRTYDYQVDITDDFQSTWLPTQFPATAVVAEGDWRFDPDTMDFLAVPDDLDTAGLAYEQTALDLDYGTAGTYFKDSRPGAVDEEFLQVPGGLPGVVRSYATSVTAPAVNDYEAALLLQDWFRDAGGFEYSLEKAPPGVGSDAFETFLGDGPESRIGYCEQFASAMAVMARMAGIPARVAVGFLEPTHLGDGVWEYSSHDLHAWTELYFEGAGWVMFEPTPPDVAGSVPEYSTVPVDRADDLPTNQPENQDPDRRPTEQPQQDTATAAPEDEADAADGGAGAGTDWSGVLVRLGLGLLALGVLVLLVLAPRLLRRRARRRRLAGGPEGVWAELGATAIDLGVPWPSGRSPRQIGRMLVEHLGDRSATDRPERPRTGADVDREATDALDRLVHAVERQRYARPDATQPDVTRPDVVQADAALVADLAVCVDSLTAGVTPRVRRRARSRPRSLRRRTPSSSSTASSAPAPVDSRVFHG